LIYGNSGTGKTLVLELIYMLLQMVARAENEEELVGELEKTLTESYGAPQSIITHDAERAEIFFYAQGLDKPLRFSIDRDRGIMVESFSPPTEEYLKSTIEYSVLAPDTRLYIVREKLYDIYNRILEARFGKPLRRHKILFRKEVEKRYADKIERILKSRTLSDYVKLSFQPLEILGRRVELDWRTLTLDKTPLPLASSSILSLFSLSPIIYTILSEKGLMASIDTLELHLTPALTCIASILLARLTVSEVLESEREEDNTSLLITTHTPLVIASMGLESMGGFKDIKIGKLEPLENADKYFIGYLFTERGEINKRIAREAFREQEYMKEIVHDLPRRALRVFEHV